MRGLSFAIAACAFAIPGAAFADSADFESGVQELDPYLQCVPYARERSGVQIYGDARTWWDQAAGRYKRGTTPRRGAVMTFQPTGSMVLGHVAAVSRVIDSRTVLLDHANWSPINGRRGQIERDVRAVDVSPRNDWSQVRVWFAPLGDIGTTAWPVAGFIYNERESETTLGGNRVLASASYERPRAHASRSPSKAFADAFAGLGSPVSAAKPAPRRVPANVNRKPADPIDAAIARYGS
ncbi:MAG: CHAP domain-containing protein [Tsuneonella sp.]